MNEATFSNVIRAVNQLREYLQRVGLSSAHCRRTGLRLLI